MPCWTPICFLLKKLLYKNLVIINASIESKALVALDKDSGKEVWRAKKISASWTTPVLVDAPGGATEVVLSESSAVIGFDPADGKLYVMSIKDGGYVVDAATLQELAHNTFADDTSRVNASPIVNEGRILLRTDQFLYCIGKK